MDLPVESVQAATMRLKRARGHLDHVIGMLESGTNCQDVLTQLAAVNRAISRGAYSIVATGLERCLNEDGTLDPDRAKTMERLFMTLA
mgnify:CR=1 FL=1|jgi:DNA-binding FrmR family transcriptional regulator